MKPICTEAEERNRVYKAWIRAYASGGLIAVYNSVHTADGVVDRRCSDAIAAWRRWHEPVVAKELSNEAWPWYHALESARVNTLASRHLPGIRANLEPTLHSSRQPTSAFWLYWVAMRIYEGDNFTPEWLRGQSGWRNLCRYSGTRFFRFIGFGPNSVFLNPGDVIKGFKKASTCLHDPVAYLASLQSLISSLVELYPASDGLAPGHFTDISMDVASSAEGLELHKKNSADVAERPTATQDTDVEKAFSNYRVFHSRWDEEKSASHWLKPDDSQRLDQLLTPDRQEVRRLARRLQRQLEAAHLRQWRFDLDEGRIDSRRLSQLVGESSNRRIFRQEDQSPLPESFVTFLVDQSGSMQGERQRMAAMTIDLAVHTLEVCKVGCEVLGYTTVGMAGNPVSRLWDRVGRPVAPGRLNAIRHIVYKTAGQPWRRARESMGLMLRDGFGCENIDGEALFWAARRLACRMEKRRILVVLTDGAPYDNATAKANGRNFLESHLRSVIDLIERSDLKIVAIGSTETIGQYYRKFRVFRSPMELSESIFSELSLLLGLAEKREKTQ